MARAAGPRTTPRVRARALMSVGMDEALWQSVVSSFAARAARRGDIETGCVQRDTGKLVCRQSVALPFPLLVPPCPNLPGNLVTYRLGKDKRPFFASVIPLGYLITKRPWCRACAAQVRALTLKGRLGNGRLTRYGAAARKRAIFELRENRWEGPCFPAE